MISHWMETLDSLNGFFLSFIALGLIFSLGLVLSIENKFYQIRILPQLFKTFFMFSKGFHQGARGTHPLRTFFASVGGMIGIGSVVAITSAVQLGGPGALIWVWFAAFFGCLIKYSEIYLGHHYRKINPRGGFDGGPLAYTPKAFGKDWIIVLVCVLLCIYGTEVYQFSVIIDSFHKNYEVPRWISLPAMLFLVLYSGLGGVNRVGKICSVIMPFFVTIYLTLCWWVCLHHLKALPSILRDVFISAFTGKAAIGGFVGSTFFLTAQQGVSRSAYSADIGIGYDSIIHSESSAQLSFEQARLSILGVLLDAFVCSTSILLVLCSGAWMSDPPLSPSELVQVSLKPYFPQVQQWMPVFLLFIGYSTIISYFCVSLKCADKLHPKWGKKVYLVFAICAFSVFSLERPDIAMILMSFAQSMLLIVNLFSIFKLRRYIQFR